MKGIQVHEYGGPEKLQYGEFGRPEPGPGQALVEIEAIGVNFIDIYQRVGLYPASLPMTPGSEAAGRVAALGPGVTGVAVGDRVAYCMQVGAYADYAVVDAWRLVPLPDALDARAGAAALLQGLTAHYLVESTFPLSAGQTCLVHAAAGGVGLLLVQLAQARGARVIGTVSTEEKAELAREAGADAVIRYSVEDFVAATRQLTDGAGVDVVYDSVGQTTFMGSLDCLKPRGMLVSFGQSSGAVAPIEPLVLSRKGSLFLTRPTLGNYVATREELLRRARDLFGWLVSGELSLRIDRTFPLAEAAEAHRYLAGRQSKGKILLVP